MKTLIAAVLITISGQASACWVPSLPFNPTRWQLNNYYQEVEQYQRCMANNLEALHQQQRQQNRQYNGGLGSGLGLPSLSLPSL